MTSADFRVRYIANHRHLVWLGRTGGDQAASFYFGIIEAYNDGTVGDLPESVREVSRELLTRAGYEKWHNQGLTEGMNHRKAG